MVSDDAGEDEARLGYAYLHLNSALLLKNLYICSIFLDCDVVKSH